MTKLNQTQIDALPVAEQIAYYKAYNAQLEAEKKSGGVISFKVSEKGCVSVYGINSRRPVSLYKTQWQRLMAKRTDLEAFIVANEAELDMRSEATKKAKEAAKAQAKEAERLARVAAHVANTQA